MRYHFCSYDTLTIITKLPRYLPIFHQLRLSAEHHERVSINAPPDAVVWFRAWTTVLGAHTHNGSALWPVLECR